VVEVEKKKSYDIGAPINPNTTMKQLMDFWYEEHQLTKELSKKTQERYEDYIRRFVVEPFGKLTVAELTPGLLDTYLKKLHAGGASRTKSVKTVLKPALDLALRHKAIDFNPYDRVVKFGSGPKKPVRHISEEDMILILRELPKYRRGAGVKGPKPTNRLEDAVVAMFGSGLRIGELLGLRRMDVDLTGSRPSISVRGTLISSAEGLER
jgi:integrase